MVVDNLFEIGNIVYLKTDSDQKQRIVTAIIVRHGGCYSYELSCGTEAKWHYEFEISTEKDVLTTQQ